MAFLTERRINVFSALAITFTVIEIAVLVIRLNQLFGHLPEEGWIFAFDLISAILLPIFVIGELIIVLWERNKLMVGYFPYAVVLQDVGTHYGIAGRIKGPGSNKPLEEPLKVLVRKKGSRGTHYLEKIVFQTRTQYQVDFANEYSVSVEDEKHEHKKDYTNHIFDFDNTELRETQVVTDFWVRRKSIDGIMNHSEVPLKIVVKYHYKLFWKSIPVEEELSVPANILKMP